MAPSWKGVNAARVVASERMEEPAGFARASSASPIWRGPVLVWEGGTICGMDPDLQQRIAHNEAVFREVNEGISRGHWPGEEDTPVAFRCECGSLGCTRMIELAAPEYERIRASADRFFVAPGHERPEVETTVETHERYLVVEKRGEAARVAEETDPRS